MSYEDEPEETTPAERAAQEAAYAVRKQPIRIDGLTVEHLESVIAGMVEETYGIRDHVNRTVDKLIEKHVSSLIDEQTRARVDAKIDAVIEEGFALYDYSGREKERVTVKGLVMKVLEEKSGGDGFGRRSTSAAEQAVARAVEKLFDKELKDVLEQLKTDLRNQADAVFKAKVVESMKGALGLR